MKQSFITGIKTKSNKNKSWIKTLESLPADSNTSGSSVFGSVAVASALHTIPLYTWYCGAAKVGEDWWHSALSSPARSWLVEYAAPAENASSNGTFT